MNKWIPCCQAWIFINEPQVMLTCSENKKVTHEMQASVSLIFLSYFSSLCDLLQRHGNMESICFI